MTLYLLKKEKKGKIENYKIFYMEKEKENNGFF